MAGRTNEWLDGWMEGWRDGQKVDGLADRWMDGLEKCFLPAKGGWWSNRDGETERTERSRPQ